MYGNLITDAMLDEACKSIKVVHEAEIKQSEFVAARQWITTAECVLFIGFGYLDANMRKLGFESRRPILDNSIVVGTHKGFKVPAWKRVCNKYYFSREAKTHGAGSISEFIADWLA
jgi:hypothetical protein